MGNEEKKKIKMPVIYATIKNNRLHYDEKPEFKENERMVIMSESDLMRIINSASGIMTTSSSKMAEYEKELFPDPLIWVFDNHLKVNLYIDGNFYGHKSAPKKINELWIRYASIDQLLVENPGIFENKLD